MILLWLTNLWKNNKRLILEICLVLAVLSMAFIKGCQYGKQQVHCPDITTETIYVHDTVTHRIVDRFPYYISHTDTIIELVQYPAKIDTAEILKDYFATHVIDRYWQDSLIRVDLKDYITQNKPGKNVFKYNILRPQTITHTTVDNSVTYNSYLYVGGSVPINKFDYSSIDLIVAFPKWVVGAGYMPGQNSFAIKGGVKLFQFKQKK
jgi:hypothetical protein